MGLESASTHSMPETELGHKTQQNYNMFQKSVFIHKNRIFPYFQHKIKNLNNMILIIIMIIKIREIIIQKKMNKKKGYVIAIK